MIARYVLLLILMVCQSFVWAGQDDLAALQAASQFAASQRVNAQGEAKQLPPVMVFISFSMPRESIIAYLRDAQTFHASVVIRGLINNSFKDTFKVMAELVKEANGGGVELNPIAFDQFHIRQVPSVIVLPRGSEGLKQSSCQVDRDYDQITGNITLQAALREISQRGQIGAKEAEVALARLKGHDHDE